MRHAPWLLLALAAGGCDESKDGPTADDGAQTADDDGTGADGDDGACDAAADTDGDGLDDCTEADLGTDPALADSDGDGDSDSAELDCVSDPLDGDEACYACGWEHSDPGTLQATGAELGDTIANLSMVDQCGDTVSLWDFAGRHTILFMTAAWCPACKEEAASLGDEAAELVDLMGIPVQGIIVLFEGQTAGVPVPEESVAYAAEVEADGVPVLADVDASLLSAVPFTGSPLPGVCLLGPDLTLLYCGSGEGQLRDMADIIDASTD